MTSLTRSGYSSVRDALARAEAKVDLGLWPGTAHIDPTGWLSNFRPSERAHAACLLDAFSYYSENLTDALFRSAVLGLSPVVTASPTHSPARNWNEFLADVIVTCPEGEIPNLTDSGKFFARKARQILGIDQRHLKEPQQALEVLRDAPRAPVLFVDDLVGSGDQMIATWKRRRRVAGSSDLSFADVAVAGTRIYYAPLFAALSGVDAIHSECAHLNLRAGHLLDSRFSLTNADCVFFTEELAKSAADMIFAASRRAGILDHSGVPWDGHDNLALALGFSHGVPDTTLPLYSWKKNNWKPLIVQG